MGRRGGLERARLGRARAWVARRGGSPAGLDFHSLAWLHHGYLQQGRFRAAAALVDTVRATLAGVDIAGHPDATFVEASVTFRQAAETGRWDRPPARAPAGAGAADPAYTDRFAFFSLSAAYQAAVGAILQGDTADTAIDAFRAVIAERSTGAADRGYIRLLPLQVDGLLARARGDRDAAIARFTQAAQVERDIPPVGPPSALPSVEWLARLLLEADRPAEAARAYERALERWPNRSAALLGLARARGALGDTAAAADSYRALLENWHSADPDLPELEEARRGAAGQLWGDASLGVTLITPYVRPAYPGSCGRVRTRSRWVDRGFERAM